MALSRVRLQFSPCGIRGRESDDDDDYDDLHLVSSPYGPDAPKPYKGPFLLHNLIPAQGALFLC